MASRIGIELSPGVCRIVEVDVRRRHRGPEPTRVRRFSVHPADGEELTTVLGALRGRSASVVVWGAPGDHRQVMVTAGSYESMRREARRALAVAGVETRQAMIDIARAPSSDDTDVRRPVAVALASGAAVRAAVGPLIAAGIDIRTLATPPTALLSLARVRRGLLDRAGVPGHALLDSREDSIAVEAYVAIEESATCIALIRDGALVAARELSWGFQAGRRGEPRAADDVASRLADELAEFMTTVGGSVRLVRQATLCGGARDLRTVAAALTSRLDIEVEPLDAPLGVGGGLDAATVMRCADMWMAWAVAADDRAPLSLMHSRQRQATQKRVARVAVAAGIVAGVFAGYHAARGLLPGSDPNAGPRSAVRRMAPSAPSASSDQLVAREND